MRRSLFLLKSSSLVIIFSVLLIATQCQKTANQKTRALEPNGQQDSLIGPESEALTSEIIENLQNRPPGAQMGKDPFKLCDFDRDGDCDEADVGFFQQAFGTSIGEIGFRQAADVNGDGTVDKLDKQIIFPDTTLRR